MTTKKNNPSKASAQTRSTGGPKKPYATLDLSAREVEAQKTEAAKEDAKSATSKPAASASSQPAGKPGSETGKAGSSAARAGTKSGSTSGPKTETRSSSSSASSASSATAGSSRKRGGVGGIISHMAAGIVGGGLAFMGGSALTPYLAQIGIAVPGAGTVPSETTSDFEQRLQALELRKPGPSGADLQALDVKVNAAQAEVGKIESIALSVSSLETQNKKLADEVAVLGARAVPSDSLSTVVDVVAGLEKQLATIEAATGKGKGTRGLAKLTAISGRLVDLETTFNHQMDALRKSVAADVDTRIKSVAEASEAAKAGTSRMDRQLASVTTDTSQLSQRLETLKADNDRLSSSLQIAMEETAKLQGLLQAFKADTSKTISSLATRGDVDTTVGTVKSTISDLKREVGEVVKAEKNRKNNAQRIVLSLELSNLKRALERGDRYESELANVKSASGGTLDLAQLEVFQSEGVPTLAALKTSFRPVANAIIEADRKPSDGTVMEQLLAGARSIVKVRKVNHSPDNTSAEAVVGRMEKALGVGQMDEVVELSQTLSEDARKPAEDWLSKVEARRSVGVAVKQIESQLKTSLSGRGPGGAAGQSNSSSDAN